MQAEELLIFGPPDAEEAADVIAEPGVEALVVGRDRGRVEERDRAALLGPAQRIVRLEPEALGQCAGRDLVEPERAAVGDHLDAVERVDHRPGPGPARRGDPVRGYRVADGVAAAGQDP